MRFTPVIVAGLVAVAKAQDSTSAADAAAPTSGLSKEVQDCIKACSPDDVGCIAHCTPVGRRDPKLRHEAATDTFDQVPSPNDANLGALHDCVADCDQGDGSEAATKAFSDCQSQCVLENCRF